MSNSNQENLPTSMSDSKNSQETQLIPNSVSSIDVDEPPLKRGRTMSDIVSESLQQLRITGTSQENPIDIAGPSQITPQPFSFICKLKHAGPLKLSMEALSDPEINQQESLRIDVDENGFNITVQNSSNNAVCHLFLKPSDFECTRPIKGKISLPELSAKLINVEDGSPLYIFHAIGFNDLIFSTLGSSLSDTARDSVSLLKNNAEIPKFPDISRSCEVAVPYEDLITMLGSLLQQAPYQVLVEITENTATLQAGQDDETWKVEYDMHTVAGRQGTEPGKIYRAMFQWAHDEWLDNTVHLDRSFVVSFHTEGPTYIVLRFIIGDFGYLEYIREPSP